MPETLTCENCGEEFDIHAMQPRDPGNDPDTLVDMLVKGRCPKCSGTVSLSFEEMQRMARRMAESDDD